MRNAKTTILTIGLAGLVLAGCGSKSRQANADDNMALDEGLPHGQMPDNADIETLPADESSVTPSSQLVNGQDAPEVNDLNSANAN